MKNIGSLKYFIMPNKRIRKQQHNIKASRVGSLMPSFGCLFISLAAVYYLEFQVLSAAAAAAPAAAATTNQVVRTTLAPSNQASAAPKTGQVLVVARLEGDRVALECPLLPSSDFPLGVESRRRRAGRSLRNQQKLMEMGVQEKVKDYRADNLALSNSQQQQVLAKIDEMPSRAANREEDNNCSRTAFLQEATRSHRFRRAKSSPLQVLDQQTQQQQHRQQRQTQEDEDAIELILWYRNMQSIYSVDARNRHLFYGSTSQDTLPEPSAASFGAATANGQLLVPVAPANHLSLGELDEALQDNNAAADDDDGSQLDYAKGTTKMNIRTTTTTDKTQLKRKQQRMFGWNLMDRKTSRHYALASMGSRMRFSIQNASSYLIIDKLRQSDSGQYKCRVDFRLARTRYQTSRLEVLTPVKQVHISATRRSDGSKLDLWPPEEALKVEEAIPGGSSSSTVELLEANEDQLLQLDCSATNEGWPRAELVWLKVDWSSEPWLTSLLATSTAANEPAKTTTTTTTTPVATPASAAGSESGSGSASQSRLLVDVQLASNLINASRTMDNGQGAQIERASSVWSRDIETKISQALASLNDKLRQQQQQEEKHWISDLHSMMTDQRLRTTRQRIAAQSLSRWLSALLETPSSRDNDDKASLSNVRTHLMGVDGKLAAMEAPAERNLMQPEVWMRFLKHNRVSLFTCLASTTGPLLDQAANISSSEPSSPSIAVRQAPTELGSQRQRDKLAKIRPAYRSILVWPMVKPREIQIFLVGRRRNKKLSYEIDGKEEKGQIELTKLDRQIGLHLNLAQKTDDRLQQVQFACLVIGSIPAAKIRWNQIHRQQMNGTVMQELRESSDDDVAEVIKSMNISYAIDDEQQWSFVKVHNLNIYEHHLARIECTARNEKYHLHSRAENDDGKKVMMSEIRTSVVLNITHQPVMELLKLEPSSGRITGMVGDTGTQPVNTAQVGRPTTNETTAIYGQDLRFLCRVNFANPPIRLERHEQIEWLINDTLLTDVQPAQLEQQLDNRSVKLSSPMSRVVLISRQLIEPSTSDELTGFKAEKLIIRFKLNSDSSSHPSSELEYGLHQPHVSTPLITSNDDGDDKIRNNNDLDNAVRSLEAVAGDQNGSGTQESTLTMKEKLVLVKCRARNALGQGVSNEARVVIGQAPSCSNSASWSMNGDNENQGRQHLQQQQNNQVLVATSTTIHATVLATDKINSHVHCPVISDRSSSIYYWSWLGQSKVDDHDDEYNSKPNDSAIVANLSRQTTNSAQIPLISLVGLSDWLAASKKHTNGTHIDNDGGNRMDDKITIICYARDKFGYNDKSPCRLTVSGLSKLGVHSEISREDFASKESSVREIPLNTENCAAKITQQNLIQKRQPKSGTSYTGGNTTLAFGNADPGHELSISQIGFDYSARSHKSLLLLIIECENLPSDNDNNDDDATVKNKQQDVSANLYLFNKRDHGQDQLVRHLGIIKGLKLGENLNRSLVLDFNDDDYLSQQLTLRTFQQEHVIVMSFTWAENDNNGSSSFQMANITIEFINEPNQQRANIKQNPLPIDRFPRTSDYVHRDRLWIISGLCVVFISSLVFVLMLWIYRKATGEPKRHQQGMKRTTNKGGKNQGSMKCEPNSISDHDNTIRDGLCSDDQEQQQSHYHLQQLANGDSASSREQQRSTAARLAIYHNSNHNGIELQDQQVNSQQQQLFNSTSTSLTTTTTEKVDGYKIAESTVISNSPYDFLIIDQHHHHHPTLSSESQATTTSANDTKHQQQQASAVFILDTDSVSSREYTCNLHHSLKDHISNCHEIEPSSTSAYAHIQLMPSSHDDCSGATLRHYCHEYNKNHGQSSSEYGGGGGVDAILDDCPGLNSEHVCGTRCFYNHHNHSLLNGTEYFDLQTTATATTTAAPSIMMSDSRAPCVIRSPVGLLPLAAASTTSQTASPAAGGFNFELNSQGEMTMTDESSSFIHDDGSGNSSDHQFVICHACRRLDNINQHQPPSHDQLHEQQTASSQIFLRPCSECHRLNRDLNLLNFDGATYVLSPPHCGTTTKPASQSYSPSTTTQSQSPIQLASTLKRRAPSLSAASLVKGKTTSTSTDRVRFVNFDPELNR